MPHELASSFDLNKNYDKKQVAINKILTHHDDFNLHSFFKLDLKMLPIMIGWFERANECVRDFEANIERRKLSAIYQFALDFPLWVQILDE